MLFVGCSGAERQIDHPAMTLALSNHTLVRIGLHVGQRFGQDLPLPPADGQFDFVLSLE